jgi:hypothetical protein
MQLEGCQPLNAGRQCSRCKVRDVLNPSFHGLCASGPSYWSGAPFMTADHCDIAGAGLNSDAVKATASSVCGACGERWRVDRGG